jgi:uncharacterized membrane protein
MTWTGTVLFFGGVSFLTMVIAMLFAMKGAWMILPFAGLEIIALGICLYLCACRNSECEVVLIDKNNIRIERGRYQPKQTYEFARAWAKVRLEQPGRRWYPSKLMIRAHGSEVEVGACLNEKERKQLALAIQRQI